jgi:predicted 3-demethylubiquinone-9 3-methyltransferase (glyoxalase superfamily)
MAIQQKITPFLWYDDQAVEAAQFYVSIFENSRIVSPVPTSDSPAGPVLTVTFELEGLQFIALNGGPHFQFTEAISLFVHCETQEEVDRLWEQLSEGGETSQCGWLKDKYGLSWQIVPVVLGEMLADEDPVRAQRVMDAMLKMTRLDIPLLEQAYEG